MSLDAPAPLDPALLSGHGRRFAIVASRFNQDLCDRLVAGALETFAAHGARQVEVHRVPGALELAGVAQRLTDRGDLDGLACLGVVLRGDTIHFDLVAEHAVGALARLGASGRIALGNCVLACEDRAQAEARCGGALGNRGADAARVVLELANLYARIGGPSATTLPGRGPT